MHGLMQAKSENTKWRLANMNISCMWAAILNFCLLHASHISKFKIASFTAFMDVENMYVYYSVYTIRLYLLNFAAILCIVRYKYLRISGLWAAILDCWRLLALHNMGNSSAENIGITVAPG